MPAPLIANGDTVRITRVDGCGRPVCGPEASFVTDCWATVSMSAQVEEGDDIVFTAANGRNCGSKKACPTFNGFEVTWQFFQSSPELLEIMTGAPVVFGFDGAPIGTDTCSVACRSGFALELWAEVLGEDVCPEEATGDGAWLYILLPWISGGIIGDLEIGNEAVNFELTGSTRSGGRWGTGPYDVMAQDAAGTPGPMLTPLDGACHRRMMITTVAPPEPSTTYVPLTCPTPAPFKTLAA
ncbi:hypothetical protein [Streptomyces chilikensis]|uniref:Uncharacterized protein n=1 Tax=Streptomyces chilikensis TaxID=1194079 RepID=A0ABV3EJC6_9ACTN